MTKLKKKEMMEEEQPIEQEEMDVEEQPVNEQPDIAGALKNINDAISNISMRLDKIEEMEKSEGDLPMDDMLVDEKCTKEELTGVPERDTDKKEEKPKVAPEETPKADKPLANPIPEGQSQTQTGTSPKPEDDMGAEADVKKPTKDYTKPAVQKNKMDEDEEEVKKEQVDEEEDDNDEDDMVMKELFKLKESIDNKYKTISKEAKKTKESFNQFENLTKRQTVVSVDSNLSKEELNQRKEIKTEAKKTANNVIKEYLSKPGVISPAMKRAFGLR